MLVKIICERRSISLFSGLSKSSVQKKKKKKPTGGKKTLQCISPGNPIKTTYSQGPTPLSMSEKTQAFPYNKHSRNKIDI